MISSIDGTPLVFGGGDDEDTFALNKSINIDILVNVLESSMPGEKEVQSTDNICRIMIEVQ